MAPAAPYAPISADSAALREAIGREIESLAAEAGRKAMAGAVPTADLERIKALQGVLDALPAASRAPVLRVAAAVAAVCVILASLAATLRVPATRVQLDVTTGSATIRLVENLSWNGDWSIDPAALRLQRFTHLDLPPEYAAPASLQKEASIDLAAPGVGGGASLRHLFVGHGALFSVSRDPAGAVDIVARGGPMRGDVDVGGAITARAGASPGTLLPLLRFEGDTPPARFGFQYDGRGAKPAVLHATPRDLFGLRAVPVSGLGFFEERDAGDQSSGFVSQIVAGSVTLADTGERIALAAEDVLRLADAQGTVQTLYVTREGIYLRFEGSADVSLGSGDFARRLNPTWLGFLFHQQKLVFLWGALAIACGLGWSARKLAAGRG